MNNRATLRRGLRALTAAIGILGAVAPAWAGQQEGPAFDSAQWLFNPLQWQTQPNGLHASGEPNSIAYLAAAPVSEQVETEAEVTIEEAFGKTWKMAGVAVYLDARNFWQFALSEAPDSADKRHQVELTEMRDGAWLAQKNLKAVVDEPLASPWQTGQTYRLRISLDPAGVEGTLKDPGGQVLCRKRFAFSAEAVKIGRPALRAGGVKAAFANLSTAHSNPAPEPKMEFPSYSCDSFAPDLKGKKTGFFHVEQRGAEWWAIDPLGRGFVPLGVDHATYQGSFCQKLGYAPYGRKNDAKYKSQEDWAKETLGRLRSWGFNLLAAGSSSLLFHRGLAHAGGVSIGQEMARMGDEIDITPNEGHPGSSFPNVFHPDFERYCQFRAREVCAPFVGDPWLFGYFLDNELAWWGRGDLDTGLFDAVMKKSAAHSAKLALRDFLKDRYKGDISRFNQAWGAKFASFDDLLAVNALTGPNADTVAADKKAFVGLIAERYFATITRAIRSVDPGHMILGCRFAGGRAADVVWQAAGRHCDLISFNYYGNVDPDRETALAMAKAGMGGPLVEAFAQFFQMGGRPMMVTEWSFPALDSGLPCTKGAGQRFRTQTERAQASGIYARAILNMPFMIGFDYFMWVDEPALGVSDTFPENTNYGLVNEDGEPYGQLVEALSRVTHEAGSLRRQKPAKTVATPPERPMTAVMPSDAKLTLWNRAHAKLPAGPVWLPSLPDELARSGWPLEVFEGTGRKASKAEWQPLATQFIPRPEGVAAEAIFLEKATETGRVLYLRDSRAGLDSTPNPAFRFERQGDRYVAATGVFTLEGRIGGNGLVERMHDRDGMTVRYTAMALEGTGGNHWIEASELVDVQSAQGPVAMTLDLTGRGRDKGPGKGPGKGPSADPAQCEIAHRLTLFPETDWLVAELLWIRNTGNRPFKLRGAYFRLFAEPENKGANVRSASENTAPRLWGAIPGDAWIDETANQFWGFVSPDINRIPVRFWMGPAAAPLAQHPDARLELEVDLKPGETFRPSPPAYVLSVAGKGGKPQWEAAGQRALDRLRLGEKQWDRQTINDER